MPSKRYNTEIEVAGVKYHLTLAQERALLWLTKVWRRSSVGNGGNKTGLNSLKLYHAATVECVWRGSRLEWRLTDAGLAVQHALRLKLGIG